MGLVRLVGRTRRLIARRAALVVCVCFFVPAAALEWTEPEGPAQGSPVLRDLNGRRLADGQFTQRIEGDRLHVRIAYAFDGDRRIEERAVFRQKPELAQDTWSWTETRGGKPYREYAVDFGTGLATATLYAGGKPDRRSDTFKIASGRTFAGYGFTLVMKALGKRLMQGERVTLQAVAFTPKPRMIAVETSYAGRDQVPMAGRSLLADRFIVHPKIPFIARWFVDAPDPHIWMTPPPASFVRWEGALVQPDDPIVRVDLLPGGESGPATPVAGDGKPAR